MNACFKGLSEMIGIYELAKNILEEKNLTLVIDTSAAKVLDGSSTSPCSNYGRKKP